MSETDPSTIQVDTRTDGQKRADTRLKHLSAFAIAFGLLGFPLSLGVIVDGAPWLGLGVFFTGAIVLGGGFTGWMVHQIVAEAAMVGELDG